MKKNVVLCIDLTTHLQADTVLEPNRDYPGVLRRDMPSADNTFDDQQYSFFEAAVRSSVARRNVCTYEGRHITCTMCRNGSPRLNFRQLKIGNGFSIDGFAIEVASEIRQALKGLVEESRQPLGQQR